MSQGPGTLKPIWNALACPPKPLLYPHVLPQEPHVYVLLAFSHLLNLYNKYVLRVYCVQEWDE